MPSNFPTTFQYNGDRKRTLKTFREKDVLLSEKKVNLDYTIYQILLSKLFLLFWIVFICCGSFFLFLYT